MANNHINYLEIPVADITATKTFFNNVFDWTFKDYSEHYTCFIGAGIDGGFYLADHFQGYRSNNIAPLLVIAHDDLEAVQHKIVASGGTIVRDIFSFPGGSRFHFTDVNGNEFAVWKEVQS